MLGKLTNILLVLMISSTMAACGFRLRGAVDVPVELKETFIDGVAEFSPLYLEFKKVLTRAGTNIIGTKEAALSSIIISNESYKRRVLTVDALGRVAEYELNYQYQFQIVTADNEELVPLQKIAITRDYRFDPDNVLAKDAEEAQIRKEMISFSVRQAMRRINAILKSKART